MDGNIAIVPRHPASIREAARLLAGRTAREFEERVPWLTAAGVGRVREVLKEEYAGWIEGNGAFCLHCGCRPVEFVEQATRTGVGIGGAEETIQESGYWCRQCGAFEDSAGGPPTLEELLGWSLRLVRKEAA